MALLDQKAPAFGSQLLLDQTELGVGEGEAVDIVRSRSPSIRQENLGRTLLDDGMRDRRRQRIPRRLGAEHHDAVLLADGFELVVGEIATRLISQRLPEFVDIDNQAPSVNQAFNSVKQVHHQRCADGWMIQQIGHVEADETGIEADGVLLTIENPAVRSAETPPLKPGTNALTILLTKKGAQCAKRTF